MEISQESLKIDSWRGRHLPQVRQKKIEFEFFEFEKMHTATKKINLSRIVYDHYRLSSAMVWVSNLLLAPQSAKLKLKWFKAFNTREFFVISLLHTSSLILRSHSHNHHSKCDQRSEALSSFLNFFFLFQGRISMKAVEIRSQNWNSLCLKKWHGVARK